MIVGDYPTVKESVNGTAFSGSPGILLQELFTPYKINTSNIYKTYWIKRHLSALNSPGSKKSKKDLLETVLKEHDWEGDLREEISMISPNVILAMGELALNALTGKKGIFKWRGSILHLDPKFGKHTIKVVPTLAPRDIWELNKHPFVYVQWDIGKAARMAEYEIYYQPSGKVWVCSTPSALQNWWNRSRNAEYITLDIETHLGFITCIGFAASQAHFYRIIREILASPIPKVNQNIKYDWTILEKYGFVVNNIVGDTMLLAHTIYPELLVGLDFLSSIYTDHPYYKDEGKKFDPRLHDSKQLLLYNAKDALVTHEIYGKQLQDAKEMGVLPLYRDHVMPAFFTYKKMDDIGIRVDDAQRKNLLDKYAPRLFEVNQTISLLAEEEINTNSPAQVAHFVYDILKYRPVYHTTSTGNRVLSTDERTLDDLYIKDDAKSSAREMLKLVILARKLYRIIGFLEKPLSLDGRMRTSYKLQGTENGRTSAGKALETIFVLNDKGKIVEEEVGASFQTIPKHGYEFGPETLGDDLRTIFVPSPGYCFVEGDQGQAEDRVVCVLAEDWEGLALLNKTEFKVNQYGVKDDRHTLTAMLVTHKKFEDITKRDRQERGKKPRHAGNYDMKPRMLAILTHFPLRECIQIMDKFHSANPKIRGIFHQSIRDLISPHGRRRDFFGEINEDSFKEFFAMLPQATISDHNKFTILRSLMDNPKYDMTIRRPITESHDSLGFEVKLEYREMFCDDFKSAIEIPINFAKCSLSRDYNLAIPGEIGWSNESLGAIK
jgi:DNA polymerase I-like protein with 3'-5' exonuclease and polymerase domains/uracil-DNA glycosylase